MEYIQGGLLALGIILIFFIVRSFIQGGYKKAIRMYQRDGIPIPYHSGSFQSYLDHYIEKKATQGDRELLFLTGRDQLWINKLLNKPTRKNLRRVTNYLRDEGLFAAFNAALSKDKLKDQLRQIIKERGILPIAQTCQGQSFDGQAGLNLLMEHINEIRELTGHPSWNIRYFALNMLVHHEDQRSFRAVRESLQDTHPLIRAVACQYCQATDEDFFKDLQSMVLNDGNQEVRRQAFQRLIKEEQETLTQSINDLTTTQVRHYIEFFQIEKSEDSDRALKLVQGDDWEIRLSAALFLNKHNRLRSLMNKGSFEDRSELERIENILLCAGEVKVINYLRPIPDEEGPLYLGLALLQRWGSQELCLAYTKRVLQKPHIQTEDLWYRAIDTLKMRNFTEGHNLISSELHKHRDNPIKLQHLLTNIPQNSSSDISYTLLGFLKNPQFTMTEELIEAFMKVDRSLWMGEVIQILAEGRQNYSHQVRMKALLLLGKANESYTISYILEQLPTLPLEQTTQLGQALSSFEEEKIIPCIEEQLNQPDGPIRASLLKALPSSLKKHFTKQIKDGLGNPDPEVREASIGSLVDLGDSKSLLTATQLLRDPIEKVRRKAARMIGEYATNKAIEELMSLIEDENETEEVIRMAISGITYNKDPKLMDPLISLMESSQDKGIIVQEELERIESSPHLAYLVKTFKDADPSLRSKIQGIFNHIGPRIEPHLQELLEADMDSIKPYLGDILDHTGYIDHLIRRLKHRNAKVRQEAASYLALIESQGAFRGILLAARDPNEEVRVMVTKALEKLANAESEKLLNQLLNDPDKRVQKYTKWALARVKVKNSKD
ncbi:HEAT repeat domain-containing protein [Spirochaeta cellobiosiphila]|uniref:HEAT repeat domain-containing protein n=1 Tax=Spirochaeta cellobiosiphila TaxID=504483 RepID=UPI00041A07C6|nr:HEAT repeat domain-containing protein [Spirochaeta cellobiosiphila]